MLNHKNTKIMETTIEKRISSKVVKQNETIDETFYANHVFYLNEIIEGHKVVYFIDLLKKYDIMIIDYNEYKVEVVLSNLFSIKEIALSTIHQQINN